MSDLDNLRPEVREALDVVADDARCVCSEAYTSRDMKDPACNHDTLPYIETIRAELLRLARENDEWQTRCLQFQTERDKARAELAAARETIKRLNRRVQVAEAGVAEKVKASAPGSLGRALANAAASKAEAELAALKARIAEAPVATLVYGQSDMLSVLSAENADDWAGRLVRLVVDE